MGVPIPDSTIVGRVLSDGNGYFSANVPVGAFGICPVLPRENWFGMEHIFLSFRFHLVRYKRVAFDKATMLVYFVILHLYA